MNTMYRLVTFLGIVSIAHADFSTDGVPTTPEVLTRIIAGAESSGEPLKSKATNGEFTAYYLRRAEYIGEVVAPFGTVHIAQLFFIRSGVRGQVTPPPRGHTFLVFYDTDFRVRGYWRDQDGPFRVDGTKLIEGEKEVFDYANIPNDTSEVDGQWPHPPIWK